MHWKVWNHLSEICIYKLWLLVSRDAFEKLTYFFIAWTIIKKRLILRIPLPSNLVHLSRAWRGPEAGRTIAPPLKASRNVCLWGLATSCSVYWEWGGKQTHPDVTGIWSWKAQWRLAIKLTDLPTVCFYSGAICFGWCSFRLKWNLTWKVCLKKEQVCPPRWKMGGLSPSPAKAGIWSNPLLIADEGREAWGQDESSSGSRC